MQNRVLLRVPKKVLTLLKVPKIVPKKVLFPKKVPKKALKKALEAVGNLYVQQWMVTIVVVSWKTSGKWEIDWSLQLFKCWWIRSCCESGLLLEFFSSTSFYNSSFAVWPAGFRQHGNSGNCSCVHRLSRQTWHRLATPSQWPPSSLVRTWLIRSWKEMLATDNWKTEVKTVFPEEGGDH